MILKNKNIVLTGAGRGIGREIAIKLANKGANLILISRTESELKETLAIIAEKSPNSFYVIADITKWSSVENLFRIIFEKIEKLDCLINNAGIQLPIGPFYKLDINKWMKNYEVNFFGVVNCTKFVLAKMIDQKKGKIINMSGGGSTSARPNFTAYGVSKTAVVRFTETLAEEVKQFNIDVNAVAPGIVQTKMLDEIISAKEYSGKDYYDALERKEKGTGTDPKIPAELISFLCSNLSDGITGKLISAVWDPWQTKEFQKLLREDKDIATLRRIDNKTFFKKS